MTRDPFIRGLIIGCLIGASSGFIAGMARCEELPDAPINPAVQPIVREAVNGCVNGAYHSVGYGIRGFLRSDGIGRYQGTSESACGDRQRATATGFDSNQANRWLLRIDFGMRMNDAFTTWRSRPTACTGCYERNLPQGMASNLPAMIAYGFAVHEGVRFAADRVWGDGTSKRRRWIARGIVAGDGLYDGWEGVGNYKLVSRWH